MILTNEERDKLDTLALEADEIPGGEGFELAEKIRGLIPPSPTAGELMENQLHEETTKEMIHDIVDRYTEGWTGSFDKIESELLDLMKALNGRARAAEILLQSEKVLAPLYQGIARRSMMHAKTAERRLDAIKEEVRERVRLTLVDWAARHGLVRAPAQRELSLVADTLQAYDHAVALIEVS